MLETDFLNGAPMNRNPNGEHVANPRVFKSHLSFNALPAGDYKKVFVFREPADAILSLAKFVPSLWGILDPPSISQLCTFFLFAGDVARMLGSLAEAWEALHRSDILFLFYEDIQSDPGLAVRRLARFMDIDADDELISTVVDQTSHASMSALHSVFASRAQATNIHRAQGLDVDLHRVVGKVRKDGGRTGEGSALSADFAAACQRAWQFYITSRLGFRNYAELRAAHRRTAAC
mmetsp:Transcript_51050/g.137018  ORF Transcript_51050/g.137018 Transcript_51050/m.137018 type:complete len:234 (-) Transcript_51050:65-766(-)